MSTSMEIPPRGSRSVRPKLDGADPLMTVVTREVAFRSRQDVMRQGEVPRVAHLLLDGYGCRYRLLGDGRRQITAILVPGDLCDLEAVMRGRADYGVATFTHCVLGEISAEHVNDVDEIDPVLRRILWRQLLRDEAIAQEWMVVLGRRTARERLAHLLCELRERMRAVGLGQDDSYGFDLTQSDLADMLGLSVVHVNRTLQDLRHKGLVEFRSKLLRIIDPAALANMAGFDPAYLDAS
jgi:CRP-like cAMP-binding protein